MLLYSRFLIFYSFNTRYLFIIWVLILDEILPQLSSNVETSYAPLHRIIYGHFMSIKSVCKMGMTSAFRSVQRANYWCCITFSAIFLCWGWWFIWSNSDRWQNVDPSCLNMHQQPNWMHESNRQKYDVEGKGRGNAKKVLSFIICWEDHGIGLLGSQMSVNDQ